MIIRNFDIVSITGNEPEANAPLVIDGDRVLSFAVSPELVESIPRRSPKVIQERRQVDVLELSPRPPQYVWRQLLGPTSREQFLRVPVCEALDHLLGVIHHVTVVKSPAASPNARLQRGRVVCGCGACDSYVASEGAELIPSHHRLDHSIGEVRVQGCRFARQFFEPFQAVDMAPWSRVCLSAPPQAPHFELPYDISSFLL